MRNAACKFMRSSNSIGRSTLGAAVGLVLDRLMWLGVSALKYELIDFETKSSLNRPRAPLVGVSEDDSVLMMGLFGVFGNTRVLFDLGGKGLIPRSFKAEEIMADIS